MEAEADDDLLRVGWRRAGIAGIDGVGRDARRGFEEARGHVCQFGQQQPRLFGAGGLAYAGTFHERRGAGYPGSGQEIDGMEARTVEGNRRREFGGGAAGASGPARYANGYAGRWIRS